MHQYVEVVGELYLPK